MIGGGNMGFAFAEGRSTSPLLNRRKLMILDNERYIDKSTGISGSGPAYVFYFM